MRAIFILLSIILSLSASEAIKCYVCHKDISNCTSTPPLSLLRECDEDATACFTQADEIIVRGCFHSTTSISLRAFSRLCHESGCNNEPLIQRSQLKCVVCNAHSCKNEIVQCNHNMLLYRKDFCYSTILSDGEIEKGCLFEADERVQRMCNPMDPHRDGCLTCQYSGCNRNLRPPQSVKCWSTLTKAAVDCTSYQTSQRLGCFALEEQETLLRLGCNTQLTEEDFLNCADSSNNTCQLCMTSMCNSMDKDRLTTCAFGDSELALSPKVCKSASDRCVLYEAFGRSFYNCESSFLCLTPFCYFCKGNMCNWNLKPALSCHVCNSTDSCAQNLSQVDEFKEVCKISTGPQQDACYSVIDNENRIFRGCYSDNKTLCDTFSSKCLKCSDQYCNHHEAVKSSLVCFACSLSDPQCGIERSTRSLTTKCLDRFDGQIESCYEVLNRETNLVERGCSLDIPEMKFDSKAIFTYCDSHFCNSAGHSVRKCISCTGTNLSSPCHNLGSEAADMLEQCDCVPGQTEASTCYTLFLNRTTIMRGCQVNMTKELEEYCKGHLNEFCHLCSQDSCNKIKLWYESCYVCHQNCTRRNRESAIVEYLPVVMNTKTCENVSTGERNGCFLRVIDEGVWKQGCVADMKVEEYKNCLAEEKACQICTGGKCNNKRKERSKFLNAIEGVKVAGRGNKLQVNCVVIVGLVLVVWK